MDIENLLKELGWSDGLRIPVANEENKALELEVEKKKKIKENLKAISDDLILRIENMKKYLGSVNHQIDQNQNLIYAHNNQKTVEENLVKLARMEDSSLTNDIKLVKKEQENVIVRQNAVKTDIEKALQQVEKLNASIKWDKDALLAWDEEVNRTDEDTYMLEKFKKEDEAKFKELELKRQSLGLEIENKKSKLTSLKNDVLSMEQALDKTGQMFRRQHLDRRVLVQQWEASVRVLRQRDEDINATIEEIRNLKSLAMERMKELEYQKNFYENEVKNNKELEKEIESGNRHMAETKDKIRVLEDSISDENDKLATLKGILYNTTAKYHKQRAKERSMVQEINTKTELKDKLKAKLDKIKKDHENTRFKSSTGSERVQLLEDMLQEEEKIREKNVAETKKLNDLLFQVSQELHELRDGERAQTMNLDSMRSFNNIIRKQIGKAESEMNRQKEILYNICFAYMEKDTLYNRLLGTSKEEDLEKYEKRIAELEKIQANLMMTNALLTREKTRLEEDMRKLTVDLETNTKEQETLKSKTQEFVLLEESGQKELRSLRLQNQDKQVDENLLKLRVREAEKAIEKIGGKVFSLEKQRLELEEAMKEREIEIKTLRDILHVRRRVLNEEISNLNSRINLAKVKVENLKAKYEVAVLKLGKDEHGQPLSFTVLKIQAAQEKFELQELGDKLDSKIKKTEKEILAMENTLKVVNATNKAFKNSVHGLNMNVQTEQQEMEKLSEKHEAILDGHKKAKEISEKLDVVTAELKEEYYQKVRTEESIKGLWDEREQQIAEVEKELREQEEKLQRAEKQLKKLIREIRGTLVQKFQTMEEKDIELRELLEQNEYGLQQLAELVAKTFDTGPVVCRYLSEKGLALPVIKSPSCSMKLSSTSSMSMGRSSASSRSSDSSRISSTSRTSYCLITPSVVTLDSLKLSEPSLTLEQKSKSEVRVPSAEKSTSRKSSKKSLQEDETERKGSSMSESKN